MFLLAGIINKCFMELCHSAVTVLNAGYLTMLTTAEFIHAYTSAYTSAYTLSKFSLAILGAFL
jgi:hypothetical protein